MTKSQLFILRQAASILDQLEQTDSKNEKLPENYRNAIRNTDDECSLLMFVIDELGEDKLLVHKFCNDELAKLIADKKVDVSVDYKIDINRETHGDYRLSFYCNVGGVDEKDFEIENYIEKREAEQDVDLLISMGFKIEKEY